MQRLRDYSRCARAANGTHCTRSELTAGRACGSRLSAFPLVVAFAGASRRRSLRRMSRVFERTVGRRCGSDTARSRSLLAIEYIDAHGRRRRCAQVSHRVRRWKALSRTLRQSHRSGRSITSAPTWPTAPIIARKKRYSSNDIAAVVTGDRGVEGARGNLRARCSSTIAASISASSADRATSSRLKLTQRWRFIRPEAGGIWEYRLGLRLIA